MSAYKTILLTLALATVALAQDPTTAANAGLTTLCTGQAANTPACELFATCSKQGTAASNNACSPLSLILSACADPVNQPSPVCSQVAAVCSGGNATACNAVGPVKGLPTARNASQGIYAICTEMPEMTNCKGANACPTPDTTTGVSNCKTMTVYSALCLEMPMKQCADWNTFCDANNKMAPYCAAAAATGGAGAGSNSTTGNGQPQDNKSGASLMTVGSILIATASLMGALVNL